MYRENSRLSHLIHHVEHDRGLTVIITAYFTIFLFLLLIAGIAVWPVILYGSTLESALAPLCRSILTANLLLLTAYVLCAALLLWFDRRFSFTKTALINLAAGSFVNLVLLLSRSASLPSGTGVDFMLMLLWFICSFFLSWLPALVPAVLVAAAAKVFHSAFFLLHRQ